VGEQRVDQRAVGVARGRVDHHSRRLVDRDQVTVLVEHVERQLLRLHVGRRRGRHGDFNPVAVMHEVGRLGHGPVAGHQPRPDPAGDLRARPPATGPGEEAVEAQALVLGRNRQGEMACVGHRLRGQA
jgi:hypothetical protein